MRQRSRPRRARVADSLLPCEPIAPFADRRFAGGRAVYSPVFYRDDRYARFTIVRLERELPPLLLVERGRDEAYPAIQQYLRERYAAAGTIDLGDGRVLEIRHRRGAEAATTYGEAGWPCFVQEPTGS